MLEYRLTIEEASDDDTGSFECITPSRHGHEIKIIVKSEHVEIFLERKNKLRGA